jgi:microcystin-dependent protein
MGQKHSKVANALAAASILAASAMASSPASAGFEPFIGEMMLTPYNFCPRGFAFANGQILSIAQNTALFSLLGTTFGGNGQTTFALPNLQGRAPIHNGQGPGLSNYALGQVGGTESTTLTTNQMPAHNHRVQASNALGTFGGPQDRYLGASQTDGNKIYYEGTPNRQMAADMLTSAGGSQPFSILNPYLAMNWCIALEGIFPSRP